MPLGTFLALSDISSVSGVGGLIATSQVNASRLIDDDFEELMNPHTLQVELFLLAEMKVCEVCINLNKKNVVHL